MAATAPVSDLIKQIKVGELILPEFQRGYVWRSEQVKNYIVSLYRKYPTGHFLIWKTYNPQRARGQSPSSEYSFSRLILDGQQRLTSIFTLFEGKPPAFYEGEKLYFDLHFHLINEDFQFYQKSKMTGDPLWIAVTPFLGKGITKFLEELHELPDDLQALYTKQLARFAQLDAIRNYSYNLDEVSDKPIEEVVQIFNWVNTSGTELRKGDLALAHICTTWPEARDTLRQASEQFKGASFSFDLEFLTRCVSSVAVGNFLFEGGFYQATPETVKQAWAEASKALEYLVNLLRNDAYIDSTDNLSTPYVLVPMVVYLTRSGGVFKTDAAKRQFIHWMYLALMWGRYSGSVESSMQADLNELDSDDPVQALLNKILQERGRLKVEAQDLEGKGTTSAFFPMAYIVARCRGAVDWFTGMSLYSSNLGKSFGLEDHHIFPQSVLYKNGYDANDPKHRKTVNEIANRAFLTKKANRKVSNAAPSKYLPQVKASYPKALQSQFVPENEVLWEVSSYDAFLQERRKLIATAINDFLDSLVAGDTDKPGGKTIADLISDGESATVEFKSSLRWDYKGNAKNKALESVIAKTMAGFMNAGGGTLLIGIGPDKHVLGLENDYGTLGKDPNRDGFEQRLVHLVSDYLGKEFGRLIHVSFASVEGKDVCWVRVDPSPKPVYVEENDDVRFYVRIGNTTQPMNVKELTEYMSLHWTNLAIP
jgi:hypothetical protein